MATMMGSQQGLARPASGRTGPWVPAPMVLLPCPPMCGPFKAIGNKANKAAGRQHSLCTRASAAQQAAQQTEPAKGPSAKGRSTYQPASFGVMVADAVASCKYAIQEGLTCLEVEFPPVPTKLDGYKGSSDLFIDSNIQLSLAAARQLAESGRKVHIVMPDQGEYDRAHKVFKNSLAVLGDKISIGHLKEGANNWNFSLEGLLTGYAPDSTAAGEAADTYIVINATCVELLNVRDYVQRKAPKGSKKVVVLWNLELDSLRGDMGLPAFPNKDMHYDFLANFRPVFFLRTRDYSKSVSVAPFLVNYSGALFREYPGPWQVMLKQDSGELACIAEDRVRYNLGELKEELQAAMGLATEVEGSTLQILRRGLKNSTWWEDDYDVERSHEWRL